VTKYNPSIIEVKTLKDAIEVIKKIGSDPNSITIMAPKAISKVIKLENIILQDAIIIKQDMLSIGGDVAVHPDVVRYKKGKHSCILMGNKKQIRAIIKKLELQPYGLSEISKQTKTVFENFERFEQFGSPENFVVEFKNKKLSIQNGKPLIMGILNVTPDSFYDGGVYNTDAKILHQVEFMIANGADIIDIGGESTKPGSSPVQLQEELNRVLPILKKIKKHFKCIVSIDTYKSKVAQEWLDCGADIINDISGFSDKNMAKVVANNKAGVVIMHIKGTPNNMQKNPVYKDVNKEILEYLDNKIEYAVSNGINQKSIILGIY